jgi:DNA-binding transcriptional regulator GbsR (MarR family)
MKRAMDAQTVNFVERMGLVLEADGLPRIAGRIFGLLLVSEEARSLDDLASQLRVSKGSASTNARLLEQRGLLERICRPADRRDYYGVPSELFIHTMAQRLAQWQRFHEAIGAARTSLPIRSPEVRDRLQECEQAYTYMSGIIREALIRWQARREEQLADVGVPV